MHTNSIYTKTITALLCVFCSFSTSAITPEELAHQVVTEAKKSIKAEKIEFTDQSKSRFTVYITYPFGFPAQTQTVKRDTELVARNILKKLVAEGRKPGVDDMVFIHVHAIQRSKSETKEGFASIGKASYNPNTDQIKFSR